MYTKSLLLVVFLFLVSFVNAQDPEFSQFYANKLYLNPAFAGTKGCPELSFNFRNQWNGEQGGVSTSSVSYDQFSKSLNGGIGFIAMHDNVTNSLLVNNQFSAIYAFHLKLSRKYTLSFGVQGTIVNKSIDLSRFQFGDQLNIQNSFVGSTSETSLNQSKMFADFSSGLLLYSDRLFVGISTFHITQPNESFFDNNKSKLPLRFSLHSGYKFNFNEKNKYRQTSSLTPSILIRYQGVSISNKGGESDFTQYLLGVYYKYGVFSLGSWYRLGDSFITTIGLDVKSFNFGYSFDYTTSRFGIQNGGAHEISFQLKLPCKVTRKKMRAISCPSF
jgi:type IX secretion system PorP/SprF family membrane protein